MADVQQEPQDEQNDAEKAPEDGASVDNAINSKKPKAGQPAQFNTEITIHPDKPLANYNIGEVKAFEARGKGNSPERLIAYLCEKHLSPRINVGANYNKIINPNMARLVASGVVFWPPEQKQRYVMLYENNLGSAIVDQDENAGHGWDQDMVLNNILKPLFSVLQDLRDKEVVHGHIRPKNIFNGGSKSMERVVLGDCLSVPPWSNMPVVYLPIEKAMADPAARGRGTTEDDLYSFGVTLAVLLRASDPMEGFTDAQIIENKVKVGSYQALTGKDRFKGAILELLRGLLYDDPHQRWTIDEVEAWLDGRRLSPKQAPKKMKASRPLELNGKKHIYPETLAMNMPHSVTESAHLVENDDLNQWVQRAVENKLLLEAVDKAKDIAAEQGKGGSYQEKLVTRVCMALHPGAPIRYKGINILPEGVGMALTNAYLQNEDIQTYVEFFNQSFVMQWVDMERSGFIDSGALISRFDSCRAFIRQTGVGFGLERCIYYLDPCVPCLSDKLSDYYVRTPEDIMFAFEDLSQKEDRPKMFFDRHINAFLSVKDRKNIDPYAFELGDDAEYRNILGELKTLATIQKRSRMDKFPGIAGWIAYNLEPVYDRIHDRKLRTSLQKKVAKLHPKGDLTKIAAIFDETEMYSGDSSQFFRAIHEFVRLKNERVKLEYDLEHSKTYGYDTGRQAAAILSCILASIIILASTFMAFGSFLG
ncbi:MAG: serine/threonine-protein kinase [Pseudomonadota bacterium]